MSDNRKYDKGLVDKIREKEYVKNVDGIDILFKPVPDDDREHVMDPRLYATAKKKKAMFKERGKGGYSLLNERYRPDKVTYDLNETEIETDERLISVNDDHMIDIFLYRRKDDEGKKLPVMIYLHGGGWTAGNVHLYEKQMKLIAEKAHAVTVFPEYRLAPECPFPGPIDDCYATVNYIYDHADELNIDKDKLMVAGDSAGGGLTNSCVIKDISDRKIIKEVFELYPSFDARNPKDVKEFTWSYDVYPMLEEQADVIHSRIDRIRLGHENTSEDSLYIQRKTTLDDPLISPMCASEEILKQFPSMIICNSEFDYLRVSAEYAARRFDSLGVPVKLVTYCGCDHGFLDNLGSTVQAEEVCGFIAEEIQQM